jgi:hypothetical protein
MDTKEVEEIEAEEPPICPPSISGQLWALIPEARRRAALEEAASNLRRAIHPEDSVLAFLARLGISPPPRRDGRNR